MTNLIQRRAIVVMLPFLLLSTSARGAERGHAARTANRTSPIIRLERCRVQSKQLAVLASPQSGILADVSLSEGDRVKAGTVIVRLDDRVAQATLDVAEKEAASDVEIRAAEKAAQVARVEYEQALDSNRRFPNAVSALELGRLRLTAERSVLQVEFARHRQGLAQLRAREARAQLESLRIVAPFDGVVTQVHKSAGEAVRPGDPILEVANPDAIVVESYIDVADLPFVHRGTPAQVILDSFHTKTVSASQPSVGQITFVDVRVNPVSGQIRIRAEVANDAGLLRAGQLTQMTVNGSIQPPRHQRPMLDPDQPVVKNASTRPVPLPTSSR